MPVVIRPEEGNSGGGSWGGIEVRDLGYEYPYGLDLKPGSKLHGDVVAKVMARADESFRVMQERHPTWQRIDETMTAYIPLSEKEKALRKRGRADDEFHHRNRPVSIVVPYSYATLETLLTYLTEAYLSDTMLQYEGAAPEDEIGAKLLELVVDYQVRHTKAGLVVHTAFQDALKYGLGITTFEWVTRWGRKAVVREIPRYGLSGEVLGVERVKQNEDALLYEGNRITSIDPYRYLPDPNVSVERVQDGEYVGWSDRVTKYRLLAQEKADPTLFNVRYLAARDYGQRSSRFTPDHSRRTTNVGQSEGLTAQTAHTGYVTLVHMYITIIPREWGLGESDDPEVWLFTVADDTLLLRAMPIDMNHGQYPIAVCAPDYDGYSTTPISRMEVIHGLQDVLNWLFNSHITNVRKAINNMLIVDPSMVVMKDLEKPGPGLLVRMRRSAWGRGVEGAVKQLRVDDVTKQNIADAVFVMDLIQRSSGAVDALQGIMRAGGERRSAQEAFNSFRSAVSRLEHISRIASLQYMQDLAYFYASHTQQYMSQEVYVKATGTWPEVLLREYGQAGGVRVSPFDVVVDFDVIFKDGSVPTSRAGGAQVWVQLFQSIVSNPELIQSFDVGRIFVHIARMMGAKNVWDFVRGGGEVAAQVQPDQVVEAAARAGNLVPVEALGEAA